MKIAIIIIAVMATVASVNGGFLEQLPNWIQECTNQGKWTKETAQRLSTLSNLKAKDAACPLKCLGIQSGVISSSGKINLKELIKDIVESHKFDSNTADQIHKFAESCANMAESDNGECKPAGALAHCLSQMLRKS